MNKAKDLLRDGAKAFAIGLLFSAAFGLVLFLAGFLIRGMAVAAGLEVMKDGLLLVAALSMFIIAGMLLVKGKNPEKFSRKNGWREHFKVMGYKTVMGIICIAMLIAASAADYMLLLMRK